MILKCDLWRKIHAQKEEIKQLKEKLNTAEEMYIKLFENDKEEFSKQRGKYEVSLALIRDLIGEIEC